MFKEKIIAAGLGATHPIRGLSDEEIAEIEESQSVKLPKIYLLFLKECGAAAGELFRDVHFTYAALIHLKQELRNLIEEEGGDFQLPDNAFVFNAYQGYQFHYFVCDQDDPPIFRVYDNGTVEPAANSFSQYIHDAIGPFDLFRQTPK